MINLDKSRIARHMKIRVVRSTIEINALKDKIFHDSIKKTYAI